MHMRWRSSTVKRAIQITGNLSKVYKRSQVQVQLTRQEILQVARELDELKAMAEIPGAIDVYQKYAAILNPYLQAYELGLHTPLADDRQVAC